MLSFHPNQTWTVKYIQHLKPSRCSHFTQTKPEQLNIYNILNHQDALISPLTKPEQLNIYNILNHQDALISPLTKHEQLNIYNILNHQHALISPKPNLNS